MMKLSYMTSCSGRSRRYRGVRQDLGRPWMIGAAAVTGLVVLATALLYLGDDGADEPAGQAGPPVAGSPTPTPGGSFGPGASRSPAASPVPQEPAGPGPGFVPMFTVGRQVRFDFSTRESAR